MFDRVQITPLRLMGVIRRSWGEWPSGLRHCDQNRKVPGSNPTRRSAGLRTHPRYKAPGDLRVEYVKRKCLTSGE